MKNGRRLAFEGHGIYDLRLNRVDEQHITNSKAFKPAYAISILRPSANWIFNPQK